MSVIEVFLFDLRSPIVTVVITLAYHIEHVT